MLTLEKRTIRVLCIAAAAVAAALFAPAASAQTQPNPSDVAAMRSLAGNWRMVQSYEGVGLVLDKCWHEQVVFFDDRVWVSFVSDWRVDPRNCNRSSDRPSYLELRIINGQLLGRYTNPAITFVGGTFGGDGLSWRFSRDGAEYNTLLRREGTLPMH